MFTDDSPTSEPMRPHRRPRRMRRVSPAARPRAITYRGPAVASPAVERVLALTSAKVNRFPLEEA